MNQRQRPVGQDGARGSGLGGQTLSPNLTPATDSGHDAAPMSRADRGNLERLARKRAKVATSMIGERVKVLRADVEDQLSAEYEFDDAVWADITRQAQAEVAKADAKVASICRAMGVAEHLRPSLTVGWQGRGENALASRRTELRRLAHTRIDAAAESAKVAIERSLLEVETGLIRDGLESAQAVKFIEAMPSPDELLSPVRVGELEPEAAHSRDNRFGDEMRGRFGGWSPPLEAAGELLTPSSATNREAKRQAVAQALAANPQASNRELGRLVGADHKTVGKLRSVGGEIPSDRGEVPTAFPTDGEAEVDQ